MADQTGNEFIPPAIAHPMREIANKFGNQEAWNEMYKVHVTPWNLGRASLALSSPPVLQRIPQDARCLVPGCGEGYDVFLLAETGANRKVVGLDLAPLAHEKSLALIKEHLSEDVQKRVELRLDNFFTYAATFKDVPGDKKFTFLFDYTFLCALDPTMRKDWATSMATLLEGGGKGVLLTLMYPLYKNLDGVSLEGPPFPLTVEIYHSLLDEHFILESLEECGDDISPGNRKGKEMIGWWRRK